MQSPEWEDNDSPDFAETGAQASLTKAAAAGAAPARISRATCDKVHILELRRRYEERLDSKRIEMEYGCDYLDDESIQ